jgi:hypothetical protein
LYDNEGWSIARAAHARKGAAARAEKCARRLGSARQIAYRERIPPRVMGRRGAHKERRMPQESRETVLPDAARALEALETRRADIMRQMVVLNERMANISQQLDENFCDCKETGGGRGLRWRAKALGAKRHTSMARLRLQDELGEINRATGACQEQARTAKPRVRDTIQVFCDVAHELLDDLTLQRLWGEVRRRRADDNGC